MPRRIEDYGLIGDCRTAALVGIDGSIDWLCVPRFDSGACFAALLGTPENGRWRIAPKDVTRATRRRYREGSLILETEFENESGAVRIVDAMALNSESPTVIRLVEGLRGSVSMSFELIARFDYGLIVPWVRRYDGGISMIAGPDKLRLTSGVETRGENLTTVAEFPVSQGQRIPFALTWHPSYESPPPEIDVEKAIEATDQTWRDWSQRCSYDGPYRDAVQRSLLTLKALTYHPTGGILAAPTASLPENPGGVRNWDYRYCWLRDATFTLYALMVGGYHEEAVAWREWLLRAVAGKGSQLQILYGMAGERRIPEFEIPWLSGFESSRPVRIGNAASEQFQLDVYGEVIDVLHQCRRFGVPPDDNAWRLVSELINFLESAWDDPDEGIWEVRGGRRHFTHSKVMAWVAFDRAVKSVEKRGREGPLERWKHIRDEIHAEVCRGGFSTSLNSFVQSFGSEELDASLLMIPLVGFLPADDPRMLGTVAAIERKLRNNGFVLRYATESAVDGLPPGEGVFLPCTFWLADNYALQGRKDDARRLYEELLALRNDLGLIAEEYDPVGKRLVGNFPQAFTHVSLVNTAHNLSSGGGPAEHRQGS